jgi:hypothetical protein
MLMRLDLALITKAAGRLVAGEVVALVEEGRKDIKPTVMSYIPEWNEPLGLTSFGWESLAETNRQLPGYAFLFLKGRGFVGDFTLYLG